MTTEQELQNEIAAMWNDMRKDLGMVIDAPARKVGMPWTLPYEGVCFPVESDGDFILVSIPTDQVLRFAAALVVLIPESIKFDNECDAAMVVHEAISKAKGE